MERYGNPTKDTKSLATSINAFKSEYVGFGKSDYAIAS